MCRRRVNSLFAMYVCASMPKGLPRAQSTHRATTSDALLTRECL